MSPTPRLAAAFAVSLFLAACNCSTPVDPDGGSGGGSATGGGAATGGGSATGGGNGSDGGVCTLKANGVSCAGDGECCSSRCNPTSRVCDTGAGLCQALGDTCIS